MDSIRRKGSAAVAIAAAVAGVATAAAPALAGTVTLETATMSAPKSPSWEAGFTTWRAAPGEANRLSVVFDGDTIVLRDAGAPLAAGRGCRALADGAVACTPARGVSGNQFAGEAGDGDDTVALQAPDSGYATVRLGEGDDRVETHGARLVAYGGPGADVLVGGAGNDTLTGERWAADLVEGRGGDDELSGYGPRTASAEVLRLGGGDGDDVLYASGHADLDGGTGDDYLWGYSQGSAHCGPGRDRIEPAAGTLVARDCEAIETVRFELTRLRPGADRLGVTIRATGYQHAGTCGAELLLRADGRTLARRFVRLPDERERRLQLVPRTALPATGRLVVGYVRCDRARRPVGDRNSRQGVRVALR